MFILFLFNVGISQDLVRCIDPVFQETVDKYLQYTVPTISVADAYANRASFVFLDAREKQEYDVSHIEHAIYIGYKKFNPHNLSELDKSKPIIVYCSIGYRSEKIGEKIKKMGFEKVYNLYGSIFEWANQHYPVYDEKGTTKKIHGFNKKWSKWVSNEELEILW